MGWSKVDWIHGLTTIYREGVATYISKRIAKNFSEDIYYSFDESGVAWLDYCVKHHYEIATAFLNDSKEWTFEKEREWFRLSGGSYFGYNRLGYYLGTRFVEDLAKERGENEALTYWAVHDLKPKVIRWLEEQTSGKAVR